MTLTSSNYFSAEANREYLSVSQYKDFVGSTGIKGCEARALAELNGEYEREKSTALLVGSYVDSYFEGSLEQFKAENCEIFTKQGSLKAEYRQAEEIISRVEKDPYFMKFMSGQKQVIMTGEIGGVPWKIKIDSYIPDTCIVDLKIVKSIRERFYVKKYGFTDFITNWGYEIQGAVYQEIVRQNTGKTLPFYIAAASKEKVTDIEIIQINDEALAAALEKIKEHVERVVKIKNGEIEPERCGTCDYCKFTKVLSRPMLYTDLILDEMEDTD
nr:MAG TPA: Putative exonuclease [Caudoviricetes sp.]